MTPIDPIEQLTSLCAEADDIDKFTVDATALLRAVDSAAAPYSATTVDLAHRLVDSTLARLQTVAELSDLHARVDNAQKLANMGDYDWHIGSDTNRWSDHLYRIYGYEPGAFNASYDRFMELIHPDDRDRIAAIHRHAYATGEPYHMIERIVRPNGETAYLESNGEVITDDTGAPVRMRGTCIDITARVKAEEASQAAEQALRDADLRRRQALELNDNVVQSLAAAVYTLDDGNLAAGVAQVERTLTAARRMMNNWLEQLQGDPLRPGDLVREEPSGAADAEAVPGGAPARPRVLLVDDNDDIRRLLRTKLARSNQYEVVGEAADGQEAIDRVAELRPDVVLLDLAMPVMDGLEALPHIRARVPEARVIVLSGFDQATMAQRALAAGAVRYVEKGLRLNLDEIIDAALSEPLSA
jgi:PAS domain S-box-containing protein